MSERLKEIDKHDIGAMDNGVYKIKGTDYLVQVATFCEGEVEVPVHCKSDYPPMKTVTRYKTVLTVIKEEGYDCRCDTIMSDDDEHSWCSSYCEEAFEMMTRNW